MESVRVIWLLASFQASMAFAAGAALVSFFLLRRSRKYFMKTRNENLGSKGRVAPPPSAVAHVDVNRFQAQMHDTSREIFGQLDSKMSALQALIRLANDECARLESSIRHAETLGLSGYRDGLEEIEKLVELAPSEAHERLDLISQLSDRKVISTVSRSDWLHQVYRMSDDGMSMDAIAESLGAPLGDIEFAMSLKGSS